MLLLKTENTIFKALYFSLLHNFSCCCAAHIDLILSLRIVSLSIILPQKECSKEKRKSYGYVQDYRKRQTISIQYQIGYFYIEMSISILRHNPVVITGP